MKRMLVGLLGGALLSGCASTSLNNALGTPKNPTPIFADPVNRRDRSDQSIFIRAHFAVLLEAIDETGSQPKMKAVPTGFDMRRYIAAGYSLADIYCSAYFAKTDEAARRRRFGRTLTNDVGTATTTVLGLVNAGQSAVTALAAATGLADSAWRNYDDSFVISPELATVRSLVLAAQDNYRARTLGKAAELPADFGTAHSTIRRYAELCSHLGMKSLLERSSTQEEKKLTDETISLTEGQNAAPPAAAAPAAPRPVAPAAGPALVPVEPGPRERPATATPALTPNKPGSIADDQVGTSTPPR
jgi:hypothetical protein